MDFSKTRVIYKKAESYIGAIKSSVESSKDSLNHESVANIFGPTDWWIIAWPYKNQIEKPYSCKGFTACICICATGVGVADSLNQCNNLGRCVGVDSNIKTTYNKSPPAWYSKAIKNTVDFFWRRHYKYPYTNRQTSNSSKNQI